MTLRVQRRQCETCIYRPDSPLDLQALEDAVRDRFGGFKGHRVCHHSTDAVCAGFWARHKDEFQLGQVAQRLNLVTFVEEDCTEVTYQWGPEDLWNKFMVGGMSENRRSLRIAASQQPLNEDDALLLAAYLILTDMRPDAHDRLHAMIEQIESQE